MKNAILSILTGLFLVIFSSASFCSAINGPAVGANKKAAISGKVIDKKTGESLAGALVEIKGTSIKVYTDLDGNYSIDNIEPGKYNVEISYISYSSSKVEDISIEAGNTEKLDIEILPN